MLGLRENPPRPPFFKGGRSYPPSPRVSKAGACRHAGRDFRNVINTPLYQRGAGGISQTPARGTLRVTEATDGETRQL